MPTLEPIDKFFCESCGNYVLHSPETGFIFSAGKVRRCSPPELKGKFCDEVTMERGFEVTNNLTHSLTLHMSGDMGGNSQKNVLIFRGDQFDIDDGTILQFYGTWELSSFFELVDKMRKKLL